MLSFNYVAPWRNEDTVNLFDITQNTEPRTKSLAYIQCLLKCLFGTHEIPWSTAQIKYQLIHFPSQPHTAKSDITHLAYHY